MEQIMVQMIQRVVQMLQQVVPVNSVNPNSASTLSAVSTTNEPEPSKGLGKIPENGTSNFATQSNGSTSPRHVPAVVSFAAKKSENLNSKWRRLTIKTYR